MTPHLHLIREVPPDPKPEYELVTVWCPGCAGPVTVVHLALPPEDPRTPPMKKNNGHANGGKCPHCGKTFRGLLGVSVHIARSHKDRLEPKAE